MVKFDYLRKKVQSIRWIVERTFAWLDGFRRLAKDFEILDSAKTLSI